MKASDVYQRACASCHGARGTGGLPAREGAPAPRDFTEAAWQGSRTDEDLVLVVTGGKGPMPSFRDVLSPTEIEAVVQQVRAFGRIVDVPSAGGGR